MELFYYNHTVSMSRHILAAGCKQITYQQATLGMGFSSLDELPTLQLLGEGEARWHSSILQLWILRSKTRQKSLNIIICCKMVTTYVVIKQWIKQLKVL